jgi:hypothetical protein
VVERTKATVPKTGAKIEGKKRYLLKMGRPSEKSGMGGRRSLVRCWTLNRMMPNTGERWEVAFPAEAGCRDSMACNMHSNFPLVPSRFRSS